MHYCHCLIVVPVGLIFPGDSAREYEAYKKMSDYFRETSDYKTSVYFYEKCLEIAETMDDARRQCVANLSLGMVEFRRWQYCML